MRALRTRVQRLEQLARLAPSDDERNSLGLGIVEALVGMEIASAAFADDEDADAQIEAEWTRAWGDGEMRLGKFRTMLAIRDDGTVPARIERLKALNRESYPLERREEWTLPVTEARVA